MESNSYAKALKTIGTIILALGIIGSFFLGNAYPVMEVRSYSSYVHESYNWGLVVAGIVSSVIIGTVLQGLGELIQLSANTLEVTKSIEDRLSCREKESCDNPDDNAHVR